MNPSDRYSLSRIYVLIFRDRDYIFRNNIFVTLICSHDKGIKYMDNKK